MNKAKKNPILADLHTHLNEKRIKAKEYWKFVLEKKLAVVAITEHSNYKPAEAYAKLKAIQPKGVMLIPGLEAKTNVGDLLLFGEDETIYSIKELQKMNVNIEKALKIANENHLLISFAHPFGYKADSVCEVIGEKKTITLLKKYKIGTEYYNGMLGSANQLLFGRGIAKRFYGMLEFFEKNKATNTLRINKTTQGQKAKLEKLAIQTLNRVKNGMLFSTNASFVTVGSDAHYPIAIGSAIIELKKKPKTEKEFLEMIRTRKTLWKGPNIYSKTPVDIIGKKEMVEGLTYLAKKNVLKKRKIPIASKISRKISLGKRIKTIKRITKKANLSKIRKKMPKFRIKNRLGILKQKLRNLRT